MLSELHIKNLAIIDDLQATFGPGLNILTGETGAGKTILITALNLLKGAKAEPHFIRSGFDEASVIATFALSDPSTKLKEILESFGWSSSELLVLKRVVTKKKSRAYLSGQPISLQSLKELSLHLFDIVSQNQSQKLLNPDLHLDWLDQWGALFQIKTSYQEAFFKYKAALLDLETLVEKKERVLAEQELLSFQLKELEQANLRVGEVEELESQKNRIRSHAKLYELISQVELILQEGEQNVATLLGQASTLLGEASKADASLEKISQEIESSFIQIEESGRGLQAYRESLENTSINLEEVESRLACIEDLKRKYKKELPELLEKIEQLKEQLNLVEHFDDLLKEKQLKKNESFKKVSFFAKELLVQRVLVGKKLSSIVEKHLKDLYMSKTAFFVQVEELPIDQWNESGASDVRFLISPNVGEPLKPLDQIASGGELSRILLALKVGLMDQVSSAATITFDEVDSGVGGAEAESIGAKLARLSKSHQVLCVTHLPQVASFGQRHFSLSKRVVKGRTTTQLSLLDEQAKLGEIARMLGGSKLTKKTMAHAKEMLEEK